MWLEILNYKYEKNISYVTLISNDFKDTVDENLQFMKKEFRQKNNINIEKVKGDIFILNELENIFKKEIIVKDIKRIIEFILLNEAFGKIGINHCFEYSIDDIDFDINNFDPEYDCSFADIYYEIDDQVTMVCYKIYSENEKIESYSDLIIEEFEIHKAKKQKNLNEHCLKCEYRNRVFNDECLVCEVGNLYNNYEYIYDTFSLCVKYSGYKTKIQTILEKYYKDKKI